MVGEGDMECCGVEGDSVFLTGSGGGWGLLI